MADNRVEYTIYLRDVASPTMREFTATVLRGNNAVNTTSRNMLRRYATISRSLQDNARAARDTQASIASLTRNVDMLTRSLQRAGSVKPAGGSVLGDILKGNLASGAIMGGVQMLTQGISTAVREAFGRQQIQASFRAIAESPALGDALTEQLRVLSRDTILGSEVFRQAQTMMAFGIDSRLVNDRIRRIGDLTLGDAQRAQSMTLALSQMTATGRLQGQDKLQMVNAGWNPLQAISEATGISMAQLEQQMSDGKISADMVWQALERATNAGGKFHGVMDAIANTPMGQYQMMMGSVHETVIGIGQALMPIVTWLMQIVNNYVLPLADRMLPYIETVMQAVSGLLQTIWGALQPIFDVFSGLATSGGTFARLISGVSNIFRALVPVVGKVVSLVADMVGHIVTMIDQSMLWQGIMEGIEGIANIVVSVINAALDGLKWIYDNILKPLDKLWSKIVNQAITLLGLKPRATSNQAQSSMPGLGGAPAGQVQQLATSIAGNNTDTSAATSSITGGGQKVVNINVAKLLDNININTSTLTEGVQEVEQIVLDMLARVLAQGALTT